MRFSQYEKPLLSYKGYETLCGELKEISLNLKGMIHCLNYFSDDFILFTHFRSQVGKEASLLSLEVSNHLSSILKDKSFPQNDKLHFHMNNLKAKFFLERKKMFSQKQEGLCFLKQNSFDSEIFLKKAEKKNQKKSKRKKFNIEDFEEVDDNNASTTKQNTQEPMELKELNIKELSASYFFLMQLMGISLKIQKFDFLPLSCFSFFPLKEGLYNILSAWFLTSPPHFPTVSSYLKSNAFVQRLTYSVMFSISILISCLPTFM